LSHFAEAYKDCDTNSREVGLRFFEHIVTIYLSRLNKVTFATKFYGIAHLGHIWDIPMHKLLSLEEG